MCVYIIIFKEILLEVLAHITMESEKSHNLPSASWRRRKAGGVF